MKKPLLQVKLSLQPMFHPLPFNPRSGLSVAHFFILLYE